eukprot:TRINITY_DN27383_c0_g1_i1.p1 TRINITY_DN27383_c0_g1~~TRINITY_DN27383_c0_g1_i1.p1  ORF type:complete len:257 (-),score=65.98 TRINITY_DN27383_c0_g1_i1:108-878(-)
MCIRDSQRRVRGAQARQMGCGSTTEPHAEAPAATSNAAAPGAAPESQAAAPATALPELLYFDAAGRAELARLAFKAGGVEFTDTRLAQPDWPGVKSDPNSVPAKCFGSVPTVEHDGFILAQSQACALYAAEIGMYAKGVLGDSPAQNRAIDMMVLGAHAELQSAMFGCMFGDDEAKAKATEGLAEKTAPVLAGLERILDRKSSEGPYFFAQSPSLGDLAVYNAIQCPMPGLVALGVDVSAYPKLNALVQAVGAAIA